MRRTAPRYHFSWHERPFLSVATLVILSLATFSINLDRLPFPDELYHVLAARGLVETGEPRIAEGLYHRAYLQTWLTAWSFRLFGDGLAAARVPSMIATAGLVILFFVWLRARVGPNVALASALFLVFSPFTISIAQLCRFYALQSLAFAAGAILVFEAIESERRLGYRLLFACAGISGIGLAIYLQPVSLIGTLGILLYSVGALLWLHFLRVEPGRRRRHLSILAVSFVAATALVAVAARDVLGELVARYRHVETFGAHLKNQFWYYHTWYQLLFPTLWPATGFFAIASIARWPKVATFLLTVFAVSFLLNSFAAAKNLRYIAYAQPFLTTLWVLGIASLWPLLRRSGSSLIDKLASTLTLPVSPRWRTSVARGAMAVAVAFLILANPAWLRTLTLLADIPVPPERAPVDWPAVRSVLHPYLSRANIIVTTEELGTLYFLGRYDVTLNASRYDELARTGGPLLVRDPRTGRGVGRGHAMLAHVFACRAPGLLISLEQFWNDATQIVEPAVKPLVARIAVQLDLPPESGVVAFFWEQPSGDSLDCHALHLAPF